MSDKMHWALGNTIKVFETLRWSSEAGDQKPKSGDDTKCGNHYIEEGLECHDGDAHRPTPGKNPYWQGGRKRIWR